MTCLDTGFGLNRCKGPVTTENGKTLCAYHRTKREVFGNLPRPVQPSPYRDVCPTCGHMFVVSK
jgi:hypothetical protein